MLTMSRPRLWALLALVALLPTSAAGQSRAAPMRFLGNSNLSPIVSAHDGKGAGIAVDLVEAAARKAGLSVRIEATDWQDAQRQVSDGLADALIQINRSPEREALYDFSELLLESSFHIFRRTDRLDIRSMSDLDGKKVGVERAGFPSQYLKKFEKVSVVQIPNWSAGFEGVRRGDLDAVIVDRWVGEYELYVHKFNGIVVVDPPVARAQSSIAVRKGNTQLLDRINLGLRQIESDGTRKAILDRWQAKEVVYLTRETLDRWTQAALSAGVLMLLVITAAALWQARTVRRSRSTLETSHKQLEEAVEERTAALARADATRQQLGWILQEQRSILDSEVIGICRTQDRKIIWANVAFAKMLGYLQGDITGRPTLEFFPSEEAYAAFTARMLPVVQQGQIFLAEIQLVRKDGTLAWIRLSIGASDVEQGLYVGAAIDMTERHEAEDALATSERQLAAILDAAPVPMAVVDEYSNIASVNKAFTKAYGYDRQDLPTADAWYRRAYPDPEYRQWVIAMRARNIEQARRTNQPFEPLEVRLTAKDGREHIALSSVAMLDSALDSRGIVAFYDITERKALEEEVRRTLAERERILNNELIAIITVREHVIVWANPTFETMLGYGPGELVGLSGRRIYPNEEPYLTVSAAAYPLLRQMKTYRARTEYLRKDGGRIWVDISGSTLDAAAGTYLWCAIDVTARKLAEDELLRYKAHLELLVDERTAALTISKELAEAANRAKTTFLMTMSHELRTPMNAIMGMTDLALVRATDPVQIERLDKVRIASRHLLGIIKDILDVTRIEANRLTLEPVDFILGPVLENVGALIRTQLNSKPLELLIDTAPELCGLALHGDPQRLGQVLLNLTGNAIKFTAHGSVTVTACLVQDTGAQVLLRFEVRDTGIGIAAANRQRIFNLFEQIDGSLTRTYGGSGLGLPISKRLVELMGGEIGVQSEEGVGSTFWFTLRASKVMHIAAAETASPTPSARSRLKALPRAAYVLIVEDEPLNREVSQGLLEEVGFVVHVAKEGAQAVEMAMRTNYDMILMDVHMPVMDGLEATRRIRKLSNNVQVPIIALTANVLPENAARCREAGMNDFIGRPVESEVLFATLLKWLPHTADGSGYL